MGGFEIMPAQHGEFLVTRGGPGDGMYRGPLFAGSLDDCLDFLRQQLSAPAAAEKRAA